jgi:hypothetical protein
MFEWCGSANVAEARCRRATSSPLQLRAQVRELHEDLAVLRRFIGVRSGRKARYAALLVEALEPGHVPEPLDAVLPRV